MNQIKKNRIFQIIYPLFVYYVIYHLTYNILAIYLIDTLGSVFCLGVAGIISIIPEIIIYKNTPHLVPKKFDRKELLIAILCILAIILFGLFLNIVLTKTSLVRNSTRFIKANATLTDGNLFIKLLSTAVIIPALEELLYRGIICGQLCLWYSPLIATLISAFCFGILHFNIVQFIYAFIMGLALGIVYCKTKRLWVTILAHGLINGLITILSSIN